MSRPLPFLSSLLLLGAAALIGCSPADTPQAAAREVDAAAGDVALPLHAPEEGSQDTILTRADRGRIKGAPGATVWLVEVSDFQCPFCKQWHEQTFPLIETLYVKTGKVKLAYLHFPLDRIHPHARTAAEAAMCASVQGKFWELHDSLFDTQRRWAESKTPMTVFDSLARAAKVNLPAWQSCMKSHATLKLIEADRDRATRAGVESTPTFFVGDRALLGALPVDSFRVALDQAIAKAQQQAPR